METPALDGIKVVEFATLVAGPLAGGLLADLGATVVHVEDPKAGDPTRSMGRAKDGTHVWWSALGRNKRSVTLDLRTPDGQEVVRRLVEWADVVVTNFRPDTLTRWGMDWQALHQVNPRLVMLQISANGVTSSRRNEAGFGKVAEARSGAMTLTGQADGPPIATGFSQGDAVTGLMGAFAVAAALVKRDEPGFAGEWIDLALFEGLFRLIDWQVPLYDQLGYIPMRAGNQVDAVPSALIDNYLTTDGVWILVTSGTPRSIQNIARLVGEPLEDYDSMAKLVAHRDRLGAALRTWIGSRSAADCLTAMAEQEVIASKVYTVEDIVTDPVFLEREDVISVEDSVLGPVRMHGVVPRLHQRPGRIWRTGPRLGEDNAYVYGELLGLSADALDELEHSRVI
jgi:formyl-CoA transferase